MVEPRSQADPKFQSAFAYARMTLQHRLKIERIYYPPYHGKYNPLERCWGVLEVHRNGTVPDTIEKPVHWAETMTRKGVRLVVCLPDRVYRLGVRLSKAALRPYRSLKWRIAGSIWANCRQP